MTLIGYDHPSGDDTQPPLRHELARTESRANAIWNPEYEIDVETVLISLMGLSASSPTFSSSDEAWKAIRQKVRSGCLPKEGATGLGNVDVSVDPFGTQSSGTAILIKRAGPRQAKPTYICVMDRKTGEVEIGAKIWLQ